MAAPGNPADLPGHDEPGEEWFASDAPEQSDASPPPIAFGPAVRRRPATTGVKVFVILALSLFGIAVLALIVGMLVELGR